MKLPEALRKIRFSNANLRLKIVMITFPIIFGALCLVSISDFLHFDYHIKKMVILHSRAIAGSFTYSIQSLLKIGVNLDDIDGLDRRCRDFIGREPAIAFILVLSDEGKVLAASDAGEKVLEHYRANTLSVRKLESGYMELEESYYEVRIPLVHEGKIIGATVLGYRYEVISRMISVLVAAVFLVVIVSFGLAAWVLMRFLGKTVIKPLEELSDSMKYVIRTGDYERNIDVRSKDELGGLAAIFNHMMVTINQRNLEIEANAEEMEAQAEELEAQNRELMKGNEELIDLYRKLEVSERRYRSVVDNSIVGIFQTTVAGRFIFVNRKMLEIFGYGSEDEIKENNVSALYLNRVDRDRYVEDLKREGYTLGRELVMKRKDGTSLMILIVARLVEDNIYGMLMDITTRYEMQREIEVYKDYLNAIVQSMSSIIIGVRGDGDIFFWNTHAERFFHVRQEEAINRKLEDVLTGLDFLGEDFRKVQEARRQVERLRMGYKRKDGESQAWLNIVTYPLATGETGAVIRIDDVSEREQLEGQLRQAQKMEIIGSLTGGIAHDFNNILAGIIGSLSLYDIKVKGRGADTNDLPEYRSIENIRECAQRAADLINQLLTLSRKQEIKVKAVDLNEAVSDIVKICRNTFDKSIEIIETLFPGRALVQGDKTQIEQALLNLAVNSRDAMPFGGRLEITTAMDASRGEGYFRITVYDTGMGIEEEDIQKVFHPFFTTKKEGRGTGLGLTMVDNIIRNHGGEIWIDSRLGKGTSVYVVLPAMDPKLDLETIEEEKTLTMETGRETLMIVDDESMIRDNFVSIFSELGYTVFCAANGEEALDLFRERPEVRLVILDLVMPRKDGLETYREMKRMRPDLKVVLTSGYKDDPRIQTLREEGIDFLLKKPYSIEEISGVIKKLLA